MGIISHILGQSCQLISTQTNKYGEQEYVSSATIPCRFREITEVSKFTNREDVRADALLWVEPDIELSRGSIVAVDGEYYRVERLTKARKLKGSTVEFLKALLEKHDQVLAS